MPLCFSMQGQVHGSYKLQASNGMLGSTKQHPSPRQSPHQRTCRLCSSWRRESCMLLSVRTVMACTGEVDYQPPVSLSKHSNYLSIGHLFQKGCMSSMETVMLRNATYARENICGILGHQQTWVVCSATRQVSYSR